MLIVWLSYSLLGGLAVLCAPPGQHIAPLYVSAGLALAALDAWGLWMVLPVALGGFTVDAGALWWLHGAQPAGRWLPVALACGGGAALMAAVAWRILGGGQTRSLRLDTPAAIGRFLLWGGAVSCVINAAISVPALIATGWLAPSQGWAAAAAWWGGDVMGVVLGTPIALALMGEPRALWRPRRWPVALPLTLATVLLGSSAYLMGQARHRHEAERFDRDAQAWVDLAQLRLAGYADALQSYEAPAQPDAHTDGLRFQTLARAWLSRLPGASEMLWMTPGTAGSGNPGEATPRWVVSRTGGGSVATPAPGGDPASRALAQPETRLAYERARRDSQTMASPPLHQLGAGLPATAMMLFHPTYQGEPYTPQARLAAHRGTVALVVDVTALGKALLASAPAHLGVCLIDEASQAVLAGPTDCVAQGRLATHHLARELDVGGRTWRFWLWNQGEVPTEMAGLNSWALTSVGVGFAAALGALLLVMTSQNQSLSAARDEAQARRQEAERANQAKSEFMSRMSHELRTPLNAVLGFAQVMEMDQRDPLSPQQQARLTQIQQAGWHLLGMIDDVLDISRLDTGALRLNATPLAVAQELSTAHKLFERDAREAQLSLHVPPQWPAHWHVMADAARLRQILGHLLNNAVQYNQPGGEIWLSAEEVGPADGQSSPQLCISVRDNGQGLSDDQIAQLFQPFQRVGREHGPTVGRGVGLAISRHLAHLMGGQLTAQRGEPDGAVFKLTLPLCPPPAPGTMPAHTPRPAPATSPTAPLRAPAGPRHVLYVEDNATNSDVLRAALADRPGLKLTVAATTEAGLAVVHDRLRGERPDLILLDVHLPDASGMELLSLLKSNPDTTAIPVIMVSADALPEQIDAALSAGAACYLTKPVQLPTLLAQIDELLGQTGKGGEGGEAATQAAA